MSINRFEGPLTLVAGANSLRALMKAAGWAGRFGAIFCTIRNNTGASVYFGETADVTAAGATKGNELPDSEPRTWQAHGQGTIDFNQTHVYSAAGGEITVTFHTR